MIKQKRMLIAFSVLLLIMMWVWFPLIQNMFEPRRQDNKNDVVSTTAATSYEVKKKEARVASSVPNGWGRSPFVDQEAVLLTMNQKKEDATQKIPEEVVVVLDPTEALTLNGIFWHQDKPSVLIDNQVYGLGDTINGMMIESIKATEVVFSFRDQMYSMHLER